MVARTRFGLAALAALALAVAAGTPVAAQPHPDPDFFGIKWQIRPNPACVEQEVAVLFTACRCNVELLNAGRSELEGVYVNALARPDVVCVQCDPDTLFVPLGKLAAGQHVFKITAHATVMLGDSTAFEAVRRDTLHLDVFPSCPPPPPLPGDPPFVQHVQIGLGAPCTECPARACAGDSIPVFLSGYTPDTCTQFAGVEVIPSPLPVIGAVPSIRVHFQTASCLGAPCVLVIQPWSAMVKIPALPEQTNPLYQLFVESDLEDICLDGPPLVLGGKDFPFVVTACSTSAGCFAQSWSQVGERCQGVIAEGSPARVRMTIGTPIALAGLQGELHLNPPDLRVTAIRPVGPAEGMQLQWTSRPDGAEFVLFALGDERIPATDPLVPQSVLEVEVANVTGTPIPEVTHLVAVKLIGSDEAGQLVPNCATREGRGLAPIARICRASLCDMNGDGRADVRDLVLLVRCVTGTGPCPEPDGPPSGDCDGNGEWELDDVFCCARVVLNGGRPDSTSGEPDPAVGVALGAPQTPWEGEILIPVLLQGADRLGAARLSLTYPSDIYEVLDVTFPEDRQWFSLSETEGNQITLGFVGLRSGDDAGPDQLTTTVRLGLKPGATHGGDLTLESSEFTGRAGTALWQGEETPAVPLAPFTGVRLTAPRPNPFQGTVRFTVQLSQPASVDVTVFDATGRRVIQLYRGHAEAGAFDLDWRGQTAAGTISPSGVYWLRATASGVTTTRTVLFLRGT